MNRQTYKILALSIVSLLALLLLAACGSNKIDVSAGTPEDSYMMKLSSDTAKAGKVTFHITNNAAAEEHEFVVVKTDLAADQLPLNSDGDVDEDQITSMGEQEDIKPGESRDFVVDLQPGHYVLMCNRPQHYGKGMRAEFTVK